MRSSFLMINLVFFIELRILPRLVFFHCFFLLTSTSLARPDKKSWLWPTPSFRPCCCSRGLGWLNNGSFERTIPSQIWRCCWCCCCCATSLPCRALDLFSATFLIKLSILRERTFSVDDRMRLEDCWMILLTRQFLSKYSTISLMSLSYLSPAPASVSPNVTPMLEMSSRRAEMSSKLSLNTELVLFRDNNAEAALRSS